MKNFLRLLAFSALIPVAAGAATYNVYTDFSTAHNPNGPWTYAQGTPSAPTVLNYSGTNFGPNYGFSYWATGPNALPGVGINGTPYGTVNVPSGEVWMHPGPAAGQDSIVLFTVLTTGNYGVFDSFTHRDTANSGNGQRVGTYLNGVLLNNALLSTAYGNTHSFTDYLHLNAGDVIAFDVNSNGDYSYDSTGFQARIGATPEPSALVLVGTGMLGFAGALRRRFKA